MNQEEAMFGTEVKPKKKINFSKWFALGLGGIFGISHVGMIGLLATRQQQSKFPVIQPPVGPYTSYVISSSENGYKISYSANDPKTAFITKDIKKKGGFLGLSNNTTKVTEEYFMDGQINQGGPVSNHRSWQDPATLNPNAAKGISSKTEECIKAIGGAEGTGRLVGTSVGAAAAPTLSSIPFVGWVAAGWVAMFGGNKGAEVAGNMAQDLNEACIEEVE
tara:strand:- start:327 stop:986 length:660 start_codon:yes stop_codon:yes gene_type:complete